VPWVTAILVSAGAPGTRSARRPAVRGAGGHEDFRKAWKIFEIRAGRPPLFLHHHRHRIAAFAMSIAGASRSAKRQFAETL